MQDAIAAFKEISEGGPWTEKSIDSAYRAFVKRHHPDTGGAVKDATGAIHAAKKAREYLISTLENKPEKGMRLCPFCFGNGWIKPYYGFAVETCPKCGGDGLVW